MEAAQQRGSSGRLPIPECPRSFLDSIPSPIAPAPPGSLGYVITKEHVEEMRRMEKLCEDKEEKLHREYKPVFLPVDDYLSREINCELINVDIRSYPWKNTPFGDVYYSPRYNDDRYTYRHVLLTNGVRKEAERVAATVPGGLLTEEVFVHYLGIVLSSGWSHFMLFNKQFKELILRRPKEPEAPTTGEEATRIRDGAPGPNDEIDSDSGDDAEQREAIACIRAKDARQRQQGELQRQREGQQSERPSVACSSRTDGPRKVCQPSTVDSAAPEAPQLEPKTTAQDTYQDGKENTTEAANSGPTDIPNGEAHSGSCVEHVARETDNGQAAVSGPPLAALRGTAGATRGNTSQPIALPARRRKAPGPRAPSQSAAAQPKANAEALSDVAGRTRGRAGVRRREPVVPPRGSAAGRSGQVGHSEQAVASQPMMTSTDGPGVSDAVEQRATGRIAVALRPQPKAGVRRVPAMAHTKGDGRTNKQLEEKPLNAGDAPGGKRRLEGGAAAQEKIRARQRRV